MSEVKCPNRMSKHTHTHTNSVRVNECGCFHRFGCNQSNGRHRGHNLILYTNSMRNEHIH